MTERLPVLIVGAGPVGLTLACELARRGIRFRLIDQAEAPSIYSKAQLVHARTLELFESLGIAERAVELGKKAHGFSMYEPSGKRIAHLSIGGIDSYYDFMLNLSQRDTEKLLTSRLAELGGALERKTTLETFSQDDNGVRAVLSRGGASPGQEETKETVECQYLVGCDGAHSTVRKVLGLAFEGSTYEQRIIQADVRVDLPIPVADDEVLTFLSTAGPLGLFPLPGEHRYRLLVILLDGQEIPATLEGFQDALRARGPAGATVSDPAWMVDFRIHCRMVSKYRVNRVFLAGDAAHIHSPAGGQGMNTGIQDSFNLAWKLALTLEGRAQSALLDSYEAERLPIAAKTLEGTDEATQRGFSVMALRNALAQSVRNQLVGFITSLSLVQKTASRTLSMVEIGYRESPIVGQHRSSLLRANVGASKETEEPGVLDWLAFGDGPAPGDCAFDIEIQENDEQKRLFDLLYRGRHTLLLFDGAAATEEGYKNLSNIARRVNERLGSHIDTYVIVPMSKKPAALEWDQVLFDPMGAAHKRFGARVECLYLVRPDGHVAFRSQPADGAKLLEHIDRIFV